MGKKKKRGGTLTRTKWCHFMSLFSMLWLCNFQMGLIIYVSLLLLTPKVLSLPFDPQDNAFLSWAHSYATFHNCSNCWVCAALPSSSVEGFPWWTFPLQRKVFLQVCKYLQQSYVMPLVHLMTSNNPKMDWCNTLYFSDEPDHLCEPTSAYSKNTESAVWSSRQCLPVLGSLLRCISQSI